MSNYPSNWDSIRKRIYKRDNYTCQDCGASDTELHCHHITPISQGGSHDESNLITVCKDCHENIHGHSIGEDDTNLTLDERGELAAGAALGVVASIAFPPIAVLGIPFSVLCLVALIFDSLS